jgi:hypothetical protein
MSSPRGPCSLPVLREAWTQGVIDEHTLVWGQVGARCSSQQRPAAATSLQQPGPVLPPRQLLPELSPVSHPTPRRVSLLPPHLRRAWLTGCLSRM